jgi:predicted nucleotidyltransferase
MNEVTTIRVHRSTKEELDDFKIHEREPYEEVLKRLMKEARESDKFTEREKAVKSFIEKYRREYAEKADDVILYGSYARGEADAESDVDVLIVWNGDLSAGRELAAELATEALVEHGTVISPKVISPGNYEAMKEMELPFIENVRKEGVKVG